MQTYPQKVMLSFTERLSRAMSGSEGKWQDILNNTDAQTFANHLFDHLNKNDDKGLPWLFLVDELPIMVLAMAEKGGEKEGGEAIRKFLSSLRKIQLQYKNIR